MTIISDATSLILLTKINLLELFAERNKIIVPQLVYEEVIKGKDKGRVDSLLIEKLVANKKLIIKTPDKLSKERIKNLFNIKGGENEVIALAFKEKDTVLTDDKKCLNVAKVLNIDYITSLDAVVILYNKKIINKETAINCINKLEEYGWYNKELIKYYMGAIK